MQATLVVRWVSFADCGPEAVAWLLLDAAGEVAASGCDTLAALGARHQGEAQKPRVVVLAPARDVLLTEAELPPGQQRHAKQALPFLVEEKLAEDIEDVHIALGPVVGAHPVPVAVVRHFEIIGWLDALYSAGLPPNRLLAEALALPWSQGRLSVCVEGESCLLRSAAWYGLGCDTAVAAVAIEALLAGAGDAGEALEAIDLYHPAAGEAARLANDLAAELDARGAPDIVRHPLSGGTLPLLARELQQGPADAVIDLMQGGYGGESGAAHRRIDWRKVGLSFAACLAVHAGLAAAAGVWLQARSEALRADTVAQYRAWFPDARRVFDPRRQLQIQLDRLVAADSEALLAAIGGLAGGWQEAGEGLRLAALDYRAGGSGLALQIEGGDAQALDGLRQNLARRGFSASLTGVSGRDDRVSGRLEVAGVW